MTKDQYFEICEMLGNDPNEDEIPVEYEDLHEEVQEAIQIYNMLQDNWDTMNGIYLGKVMTGIMDIFRIMEVEDPKSIFYIITMLDRNKSEIVNKKKESKPANEN